MSASNYKKSILKLACLVGVLGAIAPVSWPVLANPYYYGPSFFSPAAFTPTRGPLVGQFRQSGFNKLADVLEQAPELETILNEGGPFTLLAPTDEAFEALPPDALKELMQPQNKQKLARLLSYHLVADRITEKDIAAGKVKTIEGSFVKLQVDAAAQQLLLNDAKLADKSFNMQNEKANNITFIVIDKVLLPPNNQGSAPTSPQPSGGF